ncbi:MAG: thioredoxin domain-containing protein [Myxococcales bacterium]
MTRSIRHHLLSLLALTSLVSVGCNQPQGPKGTATSCADYAKAVCKEAGEESPTCGAFKSSTEMMPPDACAVGLKKVDLVKTKMAEKRKQCDTLTSKLCTDLGEKTQSCEMVKRETAKFPPERCDMMMQHYDEVLADLKRQEAKNAPLSPEKIAKISEGTPPAFGPADAKVTIVEFSDFQCPFCSRAADVAHKVKEKYSDKVRFVFRQFPLSFHQNAHQAAEAALAANAEGKFWEYHDKLFANQKALSREDLEKYAKETGLNLTTFKKALDDKTYAAAVDAELKLGEEVAVDGTPTMFLNGARVGNPTDFDGLSKQIEDALKAAGG